MVSRVLIHLTARRRMARPSAADDLANRAFQVKYDASGADLYGSEFAFDSTGFESTVAFAKYLRTNRIASVSETAEKAFTDFQLSVNMADRGWLETTYYQVGSDYRRCAFDGPDDRGTAGGRVRGLNRWSSGWGGQRFEARGGRATDRWRDRAGADSANQ